MLGEEQEDERREGTHRGCESESRAGKRGLSRKEKS